MIVSSDTRAEHRLEIAQGCLPSPGGGITEASMPEVLAAGADAAAIVTDVVKASDIATKVRALLAIRNPQR